MKKQRRNFNMASLNYNSVSLIPYYGGKGTANYQNRLKRLLEMAKAENGATTALDIFGGAGHISLNITDIFDKVIYNEYDKCLAMFFSVLKDKEKRDELVMTLESIEPSKDSFKYARTLWDNVDKLDDIETTDVEKACLPFLCAEWSFQGNLIQPDDRKILNTDKTQNDIQKFLLDEIQNILEVMEIRQGDYWDVMKEHLHDKDAIILNDPPYVSASRHSACSEIYQGEFSDGQHIELIQRCNQATVPILLCGYDCELYKKYIRPEDGWQKVFLSYSNQGGKNPKAEYVWCRNFKVEI